MNVYIGSEKRKYERIHKGYGFEDTNKARERILGITLSVIV